MANPESLFNRWLQKNCPDLYMIRVEDSTDLGISDFIVIHKKTGNVGFLESKFSKPTVKPDNILSFKLGLRPGQKVFAYNVARYTKRCYIASKLGQEGFFLEKPDLCKEWILQEDRILLSKDDERYFPPDGKEFTQKLQSLFK